MSSRFPPRATPASLPIIVLRRAFFIFFHL